MVSAGRLGVLVEGKIKETGTVQRRLLAKPWSAHCLWMAEKAPRFKRLGATIARITLIIRYQFRHSHAKPNHRKRLLGSGPIDLALAA